VKSARLPQRVRQQPLAGVRKQVFATVRDTRASAPPAAARPLVQAWRLLRLIAHLLRGLATEAVVFPFVSNERELAIIRRWSRGLLRVLNVKLHVSGTPPRGRAPTLLVTNHVSWLDIRDPPKCACRQLTRRCRARWLMRARHHLHRARAPLIPAHQQPYRRDPSRGERAGVPRRHHQRRRICGRSTPSVPACASRRV
jgi:hypothetical protein